VAEAAPTPPSQPTQAGVVSERLTGSLRRLHAESRLLGPRPRPTNLKPVLSGADSKSFGSADGWPAFGRPARLAAGGGARCSNRPGTWSIRVMIMKMAVADSTDRRFLTV
jgi:hypothetical protein